MNKSVLITGSAQRIGRALALSFANANWNVAVHYNKSKEQAALLVDEINSAGGKAVCVAGDFNKNNELNNIINLASKELGELSCLIHNAAFFKNDNLQNITCENWSNHAQINQWAPLALSQQFVKQLSKNNKGNIITMLDYCIFQPPKSFLSYSMSKAALWSMTQSLALDLAPKVRVNAIAPGYVIKHPKEPQEHFDKAIKNTPLQQATSVEDICSTVHYLIATESLIGQMITLDGGKHLKADGFY